MKTTNNETLNNFTTSHGLISLDNKWLDIFIKKSIKIIKSNYFIDARGQVSPAKYMKALNQDIGHLDVLGNDYNKKFLYNINDILMSYMYLDTKQVNNYVFHPDHNRIVTV